MLLIISAPINAAYWPAHSIVEYSSSHLLSFFSEPANKTSHSLTSTTYRGADKSLARPGRKQFRKHVRDARDFNNIETRAVIKFFPARQGAEGNSRHSGRNVSLFLSWSGQGLISTPVEPVASSFTSCIMKPFSLEVVNFTETSGLTCRSQKTAI